MFYGLPGIGGSLGECAYCGETFVAELLLGGTHSAINVSGIDGQMAIHNQCLDKLKTLPKGDGNFMELPEKSPLRKAFERTFPDFAANWAATHNPDTEQPPQ